MRLGQILSETGYGMNIAQDIANRARAEQQNQLAVEQQNRQRALMDAVSQRGLTSRQAGLAFPNIGMTPGVERNLPAAPAAPPAAGMPAPTAPAAKTTPALGAQTFPVAPQQPVVASPLTADEVRQGTNRLAMLRAPAAALDVVQAPMAAGLNLAGRAAGGINYLFGTNIPAPSFSLTPFYDQLRRRDEELQSGVRATPTAPAAAPAAAAAATQPAAQLPDPQRLLQAMIQVESAGRPGAVSSKGAVGLMQVMPKTAMDPGFGLPSVFDFAQQMGAQVGRRNETEAKRLLADPNVGAAYGQRYMDAMLERYNGNVEYALAAYNAGPGRIDRWIASGADFSKLPAETRAYIPKVLSAVNPRTPEAPGPAASGTIRRPAAPAAGLTLPGATPAPAAAPAPTTATPTPEPFKPAATPAATADAVVKAAATSGRMYGPGTVDASPNNPAIQQVMSQRQALVEQIQLMEQYGFGMQAMELLPQVRAIDLGLYKAQADQGVYEGSTMGNWSRAMSVLSQFRQQPHQVLSRGDGTFDLYVGGKLARTAMDSTGLTDFIRSNVDESYRQQKTEMAGLQFKSQLKINEVMREETLKAQGNIQVALINAQKELAKQGIISRTAQLRALQGGQLAVYDNGELSIIDPTATTEVRGQTVPAPTRTVVR